MGKKITFIHAADLHIGAPFRGLRALSDKWANRLQHAILEAYDRVIAAALANNVDFVIIAGDIFDTARASYGDYLYFFEGLNRLNEAGIPVYLVTGNHDPYTSWSKDFANFPPNTVMFGADEPTFAAYEKDGEVLCLLGGRSYYNQTWPADVDISEGISRKAAVKALSRQIAPEGGDVFRGAHASAARKQAQARKAIEGAPFAVGVIHSGLDKDFKAPVDPKTLYHRGIDYWACGHIHMRMAFPSMKEPRAVFSGDIQGRDINEQGSRGCYLVTLEEDKVPTLKFVPTASVVWQKIKVDVSDCPTVADLVHKVLQSMFAENGKAQCAEMCVRITLAGETALHETLARPTVLEDIRTQINASYPEFFCDALIDATKAPLDKKALVREGLFPATFIGYAGKAKKKPEGVYAYLQNEFIERGVSCPNYFQDNAKKYVSAAESMVLDLLMEPQK